MRTLIIFLLLSFPAFAQTAAPSRPVVDDYAAEVAPVTRPAARETDVPRARWEYRLDGMLWSRVAMSAGQTHGAALTQTVP